MNNKINKDGKELKDNSESKNIPYDELIKTISISNLTEQLNDNKLVLSKAQTELSKVNYEINKKDGELVKIKSLPEK